MGRPIPDEGEAPREQPTTGADGEGPPSRNSSEAESDDGWVHDSEEEQDTDSDDSEDEWTGMRELLMAASDNDVRVLTQLLSQPGAEELINQSMDSDGDTALHLAALYGHAGCVAALLAAGARADVRDGDGSTPVHDAAAGGHEGILADLLAAGDAAALATAVDGDGDTPLHNAARGGHADCARMLLAAGADPLALNEERKTALQLCEDGTECKDVLAAVTGSSRVPSGQAAGEATEN